MQEAVLHDRAAAGDGHPYVGAFAPNPRAGLRGDPACPTPARASRAVRGVAQVFHRRVFSPTPAPEPHPRAVNGRLLDALDTLAIADRTVVFFASDNGGLVLPLSPWGRVTTNWPLRSGKGSAYEGGVRVPFIVRWPGATAPGAVDGTPVISADILPTILDITGVRRRRPVDGLSLVALLRGEGTLDRDALFWHYPHYHPGGASPYGAVRAGRYKLIEYYEDMRVELYDLDRDVGESVNLADMLPVQTARLRRRLHDWRAEVGAQMPLENPDHDPARAGTFTR